MKPASRASGEYDPAWLTRNHWPSPFESVAAKERREVVQLCLAGLPGRSRRILILRYVFDLTFARIGLIMGATEDAIAKAHWRAIDTAWEGICRTGITKIEDLV